MKKLLLFLTLLLFGCATYHECHALKMFFVKEQSCPSGYLSISPSSPAFCADEKDIQKIKDYCGWMFSLQSASDAAVQEADLETKEEMVKIVEALKDMRNIN
jgi:hypothetical protein